MFHCFTCLASSQSRSPRPLFLLLVDTRMIVESEETEEAGDPGVSGLDTGVAGNGTGDTDRSDRTEVCVSSATRHMSRSKNVKEKKEHFNIMINEKY